MCILGGFCIILFWFPLRKEMFHLYVGSVTATGTTQPPTWRAQQALCLGWGNRWCKSDHSPQFSSKVVESVELYLSSPKTFSRCGALIKHTNNTTSHFIFLLTAPYFAQFQARYICCAPPPPKKKKTEQHLENPSIPAQKSSVHNTTGLSEKINGILNRYNLKSTGQIYTIGVLKCSEKFKVLDLP